MQVFHAAVIIALGAAAAATAVPAADHYGTRYTDRHCKTLQSQPNRYFGFSDCIELKTVGSIKIGNVEPQQSCVIYSDHQCRGEFVGSEAAQGCLDVTVGDWTKGKSFMCANGHD
ncbi:hypothetical protein NQ176_g5333 [Zarea fungicola]|uniref:Uncharacterized protein n=1 Tax=Zarea fungicola TaxID=93591 RepID=A0ACC1NA63_9HYPO|nr:hypothetical protein NQ176_g5333 [Lecanicillium fungicola]